jgi:DNA processing protein
MSLPRKIHDVLTLTRVRGLSARRIAEGLRLGADAGSVDALCGYFHLRAGRWDSAREESAVILETCRSQNIGIRVLGEAGYPPLLAEIPDPPPLLYVKGAGIDLLNQTCVAVVGSRAAVEFSLRKAGELGGIFSAPPYVHVSGLALGCDCAGHAGALRQSGRTLAVLAGGLDMVHPAGNKDLAEAILAAGGCLLSENPPGTRATGKSLIARNRIQSGLSRATIIVQTSVRSGTMSTARFCLQQKRILACVVARGMEAEASDLFGGNALLLSEHKALPVDSPDDIKRLRAALAPQGDPR